jgi:hypothetical protein
MRSDKSSASTAICRRSARYPHIVALGDSLLSSSGRARTGWALDVLIDGILAR